MEIESLEALYRSVDPAVFESAFPSSATKEEALAWVHTHRSELSPYEGQWIAVYHQQVVAHGRDGSQVRKQADLLGYHEEDIYLRFLEESHCIYGLR